MQMETHQANFSNNDMESYKDQANEETKLYINPTNSSDFKNLNINNCFENKKIFIPNLNLNGLLDKNNNSNFIEMETNKYDFLGRKRENAQMSILGFNGFANGKGLSDAENAEALNENSNNKDIFENQADNKNSNFSACINNNNKIKIKSAIKKIGARIIKASPSESPKFNRKIEFSDQKKIIFELNENENSQRSNESKATEVHEKQNLNYNNNECETDQAEININNHDQNVDSDFEILNKQDSYESNQENFNLNENNQTNEKPNTEEIILDINPNDFTFKHPINTEIAETKHKNIPDSAALINFEFSNFSKENPHPDFETHIEEPAEDLNQNKQMESENKLFSNQNLYYTNTNQANNASENFNFEKPYNIGQAKSNNIKFSNTEIPEVFDDVYIQRRINKAEINSPNQESAGAIFVQGSNSNLSKSCNPIQELKRNRSRRVSSNKISNQSVNQHKKSLFEFSRADFLEFLGPLALIGLGCFLYTFHKSDIINFVTDHFKNLNFPNIPSPSREQIILIISIAIVSTSIYHIKKYFEAQQKIINESAKEMQEYILSILEFTNEEGLRYPDIDIEDFSDHYAKEKNISESLMKKILKKLDKTFEKKNSEIVKISLYLDGKMKSFWKLKIDCMQD